MSPTPVALPRRRDSIAPEARAPGSAHLHPFRSAVGHHVLVPDGSRIYDIDAALYDEFQSIIDADGDLMPRLRELGLQSNNAIVGGAGPSPPVRYLSLAVAQRCNLGCSYCYADGGDFGGEPRSMEYEVGRKTVDRLLDDCTAGERIGIAFLGGEPLANRNVLHALTRYTAAEATARDVTATFSVTASPFRSVWIRIASET